MTQSPEGTPAKVKKLGHVVFTVIDIERTTRSWTEIMGFQTSSALPQEGQPGFHHCALEVGAALPRVTYR
jgi:hypothetical protein